MHHVACTVLTILTLSTTAAHGGGDCVRVPAEWEPHASTWMQWPKGIESSYRPDFARIIDALQEHEAIDIIVQSMAARNGAQNYLVNRGVPLTNLSWHIMPYDWAWLRDNGPIWVEEGGALVAQDWVFDAWGGLIAPWDSDDAVPCQLAALTGDACAPFALVNERGNLEFNGVDTLITSWPVWSDRNPGWSREQTEALLQDAWGVSNVVWLLTAPASDLFTGGHVDGIARFIDEDTVVVARYVDQDDPDAPAYEEAAQIIADEGFEVLRLDVPGKITYFGAPMAANYVNWLVANDVVVMTGFAHAAWDEAARQTVETFFPGREVVIVDTRELWYWGGGVHCVTNDRPLAPCPGDFDGDGVIAFGDLLPLLAAWGPCAAPCPYDLDCSAAVDFADVLALLAGWGPCG